MFVSHQPANSANENYVQPNTLALESKIEDIAKQTTGLVEREQIMGSLITLNFPNGKIGFASTVRGWDETPRDAFRVELPHRPITYGEWRPKFIDNQNDFNVEIISIGYVDKSFLGSLLPNHIKKFSAPEQQIIENLIRALFADQEATDGLSPFSSKIARFLGGMTFLPSWIQRSDV